jgi:hypothetical protein
MLPVMLGIVLGLAVWFAAHEIVAVIMNVVCVEKWRDEVHLVLTMSFACNILAALRLCGFLGP